MEESTPDIHRLEPDYMARCEQCDAAPCVTGISREGRVVYRTLRCGWCTFGMVDAVNPSQWNSLL